MKEGGIIDISRAKGFYSLDRLIGVNPEYWLLWLCELQQWFRNTHNIHVNAGINIRGTKYVIDIQSPIHNRTNKAAKFTSVEGIYHSYEEALEAGLEKALTMI